jgi:hypothetical protein
VQPLDSFPAFYGTRRFITTTCPTLPSLHPSSVQISFSASYSQTPQVHVRLLMSEIKFHSKNYSLVYSAMGITGFVTVCVLLYCMLLFHCLFTTCFSLHGHFQVCRSAAGCLNIVLYILICMLLDSRQDNKRFPEFNLFLISS